MYSANERQTKRVNSKYKHLDSCAAGDQKGVVYNGRTCQQIGTSHHSDCSRHDVKNKCCYTCGHIQTFTTPSDIDGQCANKHGAGSYLCRVTLHS